MYSTAGLSIPSSWLVIFPSNIQTIVLCRVWKYQFVNWNLRQFNTIIMPHISCSELYFETYWQMCMCFVTDFIFLVWVFFDTYFVMFSPSYFIRICLYYNIVLFNSFYIRFESHHWWYMLHQTKTSFGFFSLSHKFRHLAYLNTN